MNSNLYFGVSTPLWIHFSQFPNSQNSLVKNENFEIFDSQFQCPNGQKISHPHLIPFWILCVSLITFDWSYLSIDDDYVSGNCSNVAAWNAVYLFFIVGGMFGCVIGSIFIFTDEYDCSDCTRASKWPGIANILSTFIMLIAYVTISHLLSLS